ncbi:dienelactone hydrolase family protein [Flavobacterium agricola]|uniref:Dienelactone hydrolase family protein n=1 Tax=Flavobacterium agricola TaxID=2870839 RepID=A0ABY6M4Z3_9FLAO|nr:alpha/beta fold hydrolase [Flavobacterium agricola]UYW02556.1 dienelactone hydrolase family protein [Flavobacterium agricola]
MLHTNLSVSYIVREPKNVKASNPLILLLHGYGSNDEDLFSFEGELNEDAYIVSARAPHALPGGYGFAWYAINFDADMNKFTDDNQAKASRDLIATFIDELAATYPIDKNDVTLIGFSQGAILSYAIALTHPEKIKNIVALSGYFHHEIMPEGYQNDPKVKQVNIFASHGTVDQVIPIELARKTPQIFKDFGKEIEYREYPVGHGVAPQNFHDFNTWLKNN